MSRIATICARGGSKGIPDKNLQQLGGQPLIAHTLEQATRCGLFDAVAVSSDSDAILEAGRRWGATHIVRRPDALASDSAGKLPAIRHCVEAVEASTGRSFDVVADLAVTSPLRAIEDIRGAIALLETSGAPTVLSAYESKDSPYFNIVEVGANGLELSKPLPGAVRRRQDAPQCFSLNGAVYAWRRERLLGAQDRVVMADALLYVMPEQRSLDVDTPFDLLIARSLADDEQSRRHQA